ncbi:MAG: inositol monophosphatase family protein [Acidimicrobiia bacterium]|nr:inositol monophosphatase family protein [Acidimicrobiia bacterium]
MQDLDLALAAARTGCDVLRRWFRRLDGADWKGDVDPVTEADREAETAIVDLLRRHRPDDAVLGEEGGGIEGTSGRRWVIDPLDGTVNFLHGIPQCAVSIALEDGDGSLVGVVADPFRSEEFAAVRGAGATLDGEPMRVSARDEMRRGLFVTGFPYDRHVRARTYTDAVADVIAAAQGVRRMGSAALDLAWVACGRYEGYWEFHLAHWDIAAGRLLVTEAGGRVTDTRGDAATKDEIVATNGHLHEELRAIVARHVPDARARPGTDA